jgi:hypothetical protein
MGFLDDSIAATAKRAVVQTGPRPQPHDALRASQLSHNEPSQLSADLMQGLRVPSAPSFRISSYRLGRGRYQSLESQDVSNIVGQQVGLVDRVNAGMIVSDARKLEAVSAQIRKLGPQRIVSILEEAATVFLEGELEVGGEKMSAARYCEVQSMVTGSPVTHCARNMHKIAYVMRNLRTLLSNHLTHWRHDLGLAGLFSTLECRAKSLGAQLPSNSPGVHQLWIPFLPFVPVMLKPGSGDPFSPARIRSACVAAGLPEESISLYYSSGPEAGRVLRDVCGHFMMFGSAHAIRPYRSACRPSWSWLQQGCYWPGSCA